LLVEQHGGQKAAAEAIGVSHGTVCTLLQGRVAPRLQATLEAVARALRCSLAALLVATTRQVTVARDAHTALALAASDAFQRAGGEAVAPWAVFALYVATQGGTVEDRAAGGYVQCLLEPGTIAERAPVRLWQTLDDATRAQWIEAARAVGDASFVGVEA
jgi:transcriptional regulator with XRE-family HTH domain